MPTLKSVATGTNDGTSATVSVNTAETVATAAGDPILVVHGNDFYALTNMPTPSATPGTPTMNPISGTGVPVDGGTNDAHIKAYWYIAASGGTQAISVTETGSHDEEKSITAFVFDKNDTDVAAFIDAVAGHFESSGFTASETANGVTAGTVAFLCIVVNSGGGSATASYTTPAPLTEQHEWHVGSYSGVVATEQLSSSGATGNFVFTAANSIPYGAITIAVLAGGGGAPTPPAVRPANPGKTWRRRFKHRQGILASPAVVAALTGDAATIITAALAAAGVANATGDAASTVTANRTATGTVGVLGAAASTITATLTASGTVGKVGAAATTVTAGLTAVGNVAAATGAATTITAALTAAGTGNTASGAATTITATLTATGTALSGLVGNAATAVTATLTATSAVAASGGAASTVTAGLTAGGTVGKSSGAATTITTTFTASGTVGKSTGAATTITATLTAAGTVVSGIAGDAASTVTATLTAAGAVGKIGAAQFTVTTGLTATGSASRTGAAAILITTTLTATGTAAGALITTPTPGTRIAVVGAESRTVAADSAPRSLAATRAGSYVVLPEQRGYIVPTDPRTLEP